MSIDWDVVERAAWIATIIAALVAAAFGTPYLKRRRRAAFGRAYERPKRAVKVLGQDYLYKTATQDSWWPDTAPVIDRAESSLDRVSVEGRWAVRRKAGKLSDKLTQTRNKAFAMVDLIKSETDGASKQRALLQYVVVHEELVVDLEKYEKAARR